MGNYEGRITNCELRRTNYELRRRMINLYLLIELILFVFFIPYMLFGVFECFCEIKICGGCRGVEGIREFPLQGCL